MDLIVNTVNQLENYIIEFIKTLFNDPQTAYDHQLNLKSNKLHIKHIQNRIDSLRELINAVPDMITRLREQHLEKIITMKKLKEEIEKAEKHRKRCEKEMDKLESDKTKEEVPFRYISVLGEYKEKLPGEKLSGRPKKGAKQYVPHSIKITLKLPGELLARLGKGSAVEKQFRVGTADLWDKLGDPEYDFSTNVQIILSIYDLDKKIVRIGRRKTCSNDTKKKALLLR